MKRLVTLLLGLFLTSLCSLSADDKVAKLPVQAPVGTELLRDLAYIENGHIRQKLDLYLPPGDAPKPLIIWIHGGAFMFGSKTAWTPAFHLLKKGFAVACVNYRLSDSAQFPAPLEDCKAAVRWLRANAKKYHLDAEHFGAWGPSAGGYFVTMLGVTGDLKQFDVGAHLEFSSRVQCVVDEYGPTDFTLMDAQDKELPGNMDHDAPDSPESKFIGGPVQENKDKAAKANPITYVTKNAPPILVLHGDRDNTVPHGQSVILVEALKKVDAPVTFHTVKNAGHGDGFGEPEYQVIEAFLLKHLKN